MENNIVKNFLRSFKDSMMAMSIDSLKEEQLKVFYNNFKDVKDSFVPPEPPVITNIIRYIATTQPTSTWITNNCSENVFDENTGEGYLVLKEGVDTVEGEYGEPIKSIFNDEGSDSNVESVVLPSQITSISDYAFSDCTGLTSITIPDSVTSIGESAFDGCTGLTSLTIGNSVATIGASAFNYCNGLTSVTIPNSVTTIGDHAFYHSDSLTSLTIGNSVTTIGDEAFSACFRLTGNLIIPNSVTTIGNGVFSNSALTSVNISNSVTSISEEAFMGCTSLTSVTIPNSVTTIGAFAFSGCSLLASVTCEATMPPTLLDSTSFGIADDAECAVPVGTVETYESSDWANIFTTFTEISA